MAKKSRRVRKKERQTRLSPAQLIQPGVAVEASVEAPAVRQGPAAQATDLREQYRYVLADLKRIGLIAVVMLAVLVSVALLLP